MWRYVIAYIATAGVCFALDFVWLSAMTGRFYRVMLGDVLLERPNFLASALFYFVYVGGVVIFAVVPALNTSSWPTALALGAALGLIAYGTYDMTNLATLRNWPVMVSVVDLLWGTVMTATAATLGFAITQRLVAN